MSECTHDCSSCGESCASRENGCTAPLKKLSVLSAERAVSENLSLLPCLP